MCRQEKWNELNVIHKIHILYEMKSKGYEKASIYEEDNLKEWLHSVKDIPFDTVMEELEYQLYNFETIKRDEKINNLLN